MIINHECIKELLDVFACSKTATISIEELVELGKLQDNYNNEELMFHIQSLVDSG